MLLLSSLFLFIIHVTWAGPTHSVAKLVAQNDAPWNLARISHKKPGANTYLYDPSAGEGVCVYILDSGVDEKNTDFEGRAKLIKKFVGDDKDNCKHGTRVAGVIGSKKYGVAKKVNIYSIKVTECSPVATVNINSSLLIEGLNYVAEDAPTRNCPKGVVVNISQAIKTNTTVNDLVNSLVQKGIFIAAAAANSPTGHPGNASTWSPASAASACTVGGTEIDDTEGPYSYYGSCVDIQAPGGSSNAWISTTDVGTISPYSFGYTSAATAHVSGLAAYFLGLNRASGSDMCQYMKDHALTGLVKDLPKGTNNALAYNGASG